MGLWSGWRLHRQSGGSDQSKGRRVAETLVVGVAIDEVAHRHGVKANHLSAAQQGLAPQEPERGRGNRWRGRARWSCRISAGAEFAPPVARMQTSQPPIVTGTIDLINDPVTEWLDASTPAVRVAELVTALQAWP